MNNQNKDLNKKLEELIESMQNQEKLDADIKISVYDTSTKLSASVRGDQPGWAASIIKVPIMIEAFKQIEEGLITPQTKIRTQKRFILEEYDALSKAKEGVYIELPPLIYTMIVASDNTATNMIANRLGIIKINNTMQELEMKKSMLGHLLCPGAPRYKSSFNPDGSNITCPDDMVLLFRHIYDKELNILYPRVKSLSDKVLSFTNSSFLSVGLMGQQQIKAKAGLIYDSAAGGDIHEVGIINNHLIVCVMLNKINQKSLKQSKIAPNLPLQQEKSGSQIINPREIYNRLMNELIPYV
jgi:beta-lactamase class A